MTEVSAGDPFDDTVLWSSASEAEDRESIPRALFSGTMTRLHLEPSAIAIKNPRPPNYLPLSRLYDSHDEIENSDLFLTLAYLLSTTSI